jgi:hypothetical protein
MVPSRRPVTGSTTSAGRVPSVDGVVVGAASKGVERLEQSGWVARQPNPAGGHPDGSRAPVG